MYEPPTRTIEAYQQLGGILESRTWIDSDGYVRPSNAPGLGIVVNEQRIQGYRV
jgi:L-alanine-DL-glutamate epimerase-like enolase superfamily enzyme